MVTSDFRPEVEIWPYRTCAMKICNITIIYGRIAEIFIGTVRLLWTCKLAYGADTTFHRTLMYHTIYGYCGLKFESFFTLSGNLTRGHCSKIQKQYSRVNCRAFSFANRRIDAWNSLDNDVLCASFVQAFKRRLSMCNFTKYVL